MAAPMEVMIVWERASGGLFNNPPPALACLLLQRLPCGSYQLILPPLPANRLLVGIMWVSPTEFTALASRYMGDYVDRRLGPP
jgi:hypothetical protein